MSLRTIVCSSLAFVAAFVAARAALGNCAMPTGYEAYVEGNTVTLCPKNFAERVCPTGGALLRQDVASGRAVQLPNACVVDPYAYGGGRAADGGGEATPCYVDECVPTGTYRYGYAEPYDCYAASCGTFYFTEVAVAAALDACRPTSGAGTPSPVDAVPWGANDRVCDYAGAGDEGPFSGCGAASPAVLGVFGAQAGLLLAGLGLLLRRRRHRRAE